MIRNIFESSTAGMSETTTRLIWSKLVVWTEKDGCRVSGDIEPMIFGKRRLRRIGDATVDDVQSTDKELGCRRLGRCDPRGALRNRLNVVHNDEEILSISDSGMNMSIAVGRDRKSKLKNFSQVSTYPENESIF